MKQELISLIIPVHNSEKTLNRCLECLKKQTYKNLEIILIENGSTDNSYDLCQQLAKQDSRIIITTSEKGVSNARNKGLEIMTGEYFAFIDSDDEADSTMYEKLYTKAIEQNADLTFCKIIFIDNNNIRKEPEPGLNDFILSKNIRHFYEYGEMSIAKSAWRTLYKKELFKDIKFNVEMIFAEDFIYLINCVDVAKKLALVDEHLYYYYCTNSVPYSFIIKYIKNKKYFSTSQIYANISKYYLMKYNLNDIANGPSFDSFANIINGLILTQKHYLTEIHKFMKNNYWKAVDTKANGNEFLKLCNHTSAKTKLKVFLLTHKLFFIYAFLIKISIHFKKG